jgi:hypothetical protein
VCASPWHFEHSQPDAGHGDPEGQACARDLRLQPGGEIRVLGVLPEPALTVASPRAASWWCDAENCGASLGELHGRRDADHQFHMAEPRGRAKRKASRGTRSSLPHLRSLLDRHRTACGNPADRFIFANAVGQSMNLEALVSDVIRPALQNAGLEWHGWHARSCHESSSVGREGQGYPVEFCAMGICSSRRASMSRTRVKMSRC